MREPEAREPAIIPVLEALGLTAAEGLLLALPPEARCLTLKPCSHNEQLILAAELYRLPHWGNEVEEVAGPQLLASHIISNPALLPLADNSADLVVLPQTLDCLGHTRRAARANQLPLLRELRRVLDPAGQIYLRVANQTYPGSASPRKLHALLLLRDFSGQSSSEPFQLSEVATGRRTEWGYARLLRRAGFTSPARYFIYPSESKPTRLILTRRRATDATVKLIAQGSSSPGLWKQLGRVAGVSLLAPDVGLVAGAKGKLSVLEQSLEKLSTELGGQYVVDDVLRMDYPHMVMAFCHDARDGSGPVVLKLPCSRSRAAALGHIQRVTEGLVEATRDKSVKASQVYIPKTLANLSIRGNSLFVEERAPGEPVNLFDEVDRVEAVKKVAAWLLRLQQQYASPWDATRYRNRLDRTWQLCRDTIPDLEGFFQRYPELPSHIISFLNPYRLPLLPSHGDLHLGNVLVDRTTRELRAVFDWDRYQDTTLPGLDMLYLAQHSIRMPTSRTFAGVLSELYNSSREPQPEWTILDNYLAHFNTHREIIYLLHLVAILEILNMRLGDSAEYRNSYLEGMEPIWKALFKRG